MNICLIWTWIELLYRNMDLLLYIIRGKPLKIKHTKIDIEDKYKQEEEEL